MKHNTQRGMIFITVSGVVATIFLAFWVLRGQAQDDIVVDLTEQLNRQGVPLKSITVLKEYPLHIEVVLQSTSNEDKVSPEDPIYVQATQRATALASKSGFRVDALTISVLNQQNLQVLWLELPVETISGTAKPLELDPTTVKNKVIDQLQVRGLTLDKVDITLDESGYQQLTLDVLVPDVDEANRELPQFVPSLSPFLENFNEENGTDIVILQLKMEDSEGLLLLNYSLDLQLDQENWWMSDDLTNEWFPHPAPEVPLYIEPQQ